MDDVRWLTDEEQQAWRSVIRVVELLPGVLDSQLRRDAGLTHFEYFTLAMLSEAEDRTLRMTALASRTNSTLPRLSHVVSRLEGRGLLSRSPSPADRRATEVHLTEEGWRTVVGTAPGHVSTVREFVFAPLDSEDVAALNRVATRIARRLDPDERMGPLGTASR